jgi:uncharacterized membrane protein
VKTSQRILACLAYLLCVPGWLIALAAGRQSRFVVYHVKQSVALALFLVAVLIGWGVLVWLTAWVSVLFIVGIAAFSLVIAAAIFGVIAWVLGMRNALRGQMAALPIVGQWSRRLPF